jgi:dTDP-4-dehydrorhamnose 3,5-epimerase
MQIEVTPTPLEGARVISHQLLGDARGFFVERFHVAEYEKQGLPTQFAQDNHSRSSPGILRGLHYQNTPPQGKLVGVIRGAIWDVIVDIRQASPTFGKYFGIELTDMNGKALWIPAGFAHGFCVLGSEPADVFYKVDQLYNPAGESGIAWNDPDLKIPWPIENPKLSTRDQQQPNFRDAFHR